MLRRARAFACRVGWAVAIAWLILLLTRSWRARKVQRVDEKTFCNNVNMHILHSRSYVRIRRERRSRERKKRGSPPQKSLNGSALRGELASLQR